MAEERPHRWSLEAARAILPEVRARTAAAREEAETHVAARAAAGDDPAARVRAERALTRVVSRWIRSMEALGVEVKGTWLVDFDCGRGFYCWRWPEERLEFFHDYDSGFAGRIRIQ